MKKTSKKLALATQTLRILSQLDLSRANGGAGVRTATCPASGEVTCTRNQACETRDCMG